MPSVTDKGIQGMGVQSHDHNPGQLGEHRGKGHALTHEYHHASGESSGGRRYIPSLSTGAVIAAITAFMLGGLVVSIADGLSGPETPTGHAQPPTTNLALNPNALRIP